MNTDLRITGIMSGIDTESIIESLMEAERIKVERVKQDRQLVIWRQEMYNDINKSFANFILNTRKLFGLTTVAPSGAFLPNSYEKLNWVKKATSSDPSLVTVSSTSGAYDGSYSVRVKQLAEGVSMVSSREIGGKDEEGNLKTVAELLGEGAPDEISFEINGKTVTISTDYTLQQVARTINLTEDIGVRATYDASIDRFFLQTRGTGEEAQLQIKTEKSKEELINEAARAFFQKLNLKVSYHGYVDSAQNLKKGRHPNDTTENDGRLIIGARYAGQNAIIDFNGAENIESSSNTITISGVTLNLLGVNEEDKPVTITVSTDVDAVFEKISEFINEYNKLVDKVNDLLTEKRYYDYKPLTDAQKEEMDEKEIELWEERAKSGLLRNDDILQRTMQNVRASLYKKFDGVFKLITEIGITTEEYSIGSGGGRLVIKDEERLRQAIANDVEGVMELLFKEKTEDYEGGLVTRIYDNLIAGMEDIIKKSGTGDNANLYRNVKSTILLDFVTEYGSISLLDKSISEYNRRIDDLNNILIDRENYYYKKFAALETALSRMNAQSMWLMQQFSNY